jgi:phosphate/phosphite/phosphonate ABC transporter binding protein
MRLSFGLVVPPSAENTLARFDELAAWFKTTDKLELERRPVATYKDLAASVREGSSDIAWLPPVAYAWLAEAVTPLGSIVREGKTSYAAALVVREASSFTELSDLAGKRAGWVDPWSAAGYVVPRLELARAKIDPSTFKDETFYGSHREALLALKREECDVVGTYARAPVERQAVSGAWSEIDDLSVRVLSTFGQIPTDVIAVRRNLGVREYEAAIEAFRLACRDPQARPLVRAVFGGEDLNEGLEPGHDALRRAYERGIANGLFD